MNDEWVPVKSNAALVRDGRQVTGRDRYGQEHQGRLDARRGVVVLSPGRDVPVRQVHLTCNPGKAAV